MKQHHSKTKKYITFICSTSMTVLLKRYYNDEFINIILSESFKRWKNIFILLFINYYFSTTIRFENSLDGQVQK